MQVTETKSEGLSREFKVALPANEIEEKISHRLKELARTAQMPGFRPGKVPVSVLRKKYGPSVLGEVLERAVKDSSQQAFAEKGLRPAMQPQIEITFDLDANDILDVTARDTVTGSQNKVVISNVCYYGTDNAYPIHCVKTHPDKLSAI